MSPLFKLPNELICDIADCVIARDPSDIEALASSSKVLQSLLTDKIKRHRENQSIYNDAITISWYTEDQDTDEDGTVARSHPVVGLHSLLEDNNQRVYARSVRVEFDGDEYSSSHLANLNDITRAVVASVVDTHGDRMVSWVSQICKGIFPNGPASHVEWWSNLIKKGDIGAIIVLTFAVCPNLRSLHISYPGLRWFEDFEDILNALTAATMSSNADRINSFGRLSTLSLTGVCDGVFLEADARMLRCFMPLSSLRSIIGYRLNGRDIQWPHQAAISNVTTLELTHSDLDTKTILDHLRGVRALQKFRWDYIEDERFEFEMGMEHSEFEPGLITSALRQYASHSLLELKLVRTHAWSDPSRTHGFIGDLRPFEFLERLELDAGMLFDGGKPQRLIDFLPSSLTKIVIVLEYDSQNGLLDRKSTVSGLTKENLATLFEGMQEWKGELPKLQRIILKAHYALVPKESKEMVKEVRRICEANGRKMVLERTW